MCHFLNVHNIYLVFYVYNYVHASLSFLIFRLIFRLKFWYVSFDHFHMKMNNFGMGTFTSFLKQLPLHQVKIPLRMPKNPIVDIEILRLRVKINNTNLDVLCSQKPGSQ